jgi:RNA-directed DNA polymerase
MLANLYFRRFLLAWQLHGHQQKLNAHIVNYADDFVICCPPGNAEAAMARKQALMSRLGLEVNTAKTRIARLPKESFHFGIYGRWLLRKGWTTVHRNLSFPKGCTRFAPTNP